MPEVRHLPLLPTVDGLVGVGYAARTDDRPLRWTLPALGGQLQVTVEGAVHHSRPGGPAGDRPASRSSGQLDTASDGGERMPTVAVLGPTSAAFAVVVAPRSVVIGCGIVPATWSRAVGAPAHLLIDEVVDAADLWGAARARRLADRVASCADDGAAVAELHAELLASVATGETDPRDPAALAIERWLAEDATLSLDALRDGFDVSYRQLARLTSASFGTPPKLLQLKFRALRLTAALSLGAAGPLDTARAADGFYDQSHLIAQFQRFVGTTPLQLRDERGAAARGLVLSRWRAGARTPTTLWS